jgi:NAD(P)H dehydrogenase (quinone)
LVLTNNGHSCATYELVGTSPLSQINIAEAFSQALKKNIRAESEAFESWNRRARSAGMDDRARETLAKMFRAYARDGLKGNPKCSAGCSGARPPRLPPLSRASSRLRCEAASRSGGLAARAS